MGSILSHLDMMNFWQYDLPLATQWMVVIYDFPSAIQSNIQAAEGLVDGDWNIGTDTWSKMTGDRAQNNPDLGCFFAQEVDIPSESFTPTAASIPNNGGFIPGNVSSGRSDNMSRPINIKFRETNLSFSNLVIRPWAIMAAHLGMIATGNDNENVKASRLQVIQFTRKLPGFTAVQRPIRQITNFYGVSPYAVESNNLSYDGESFDKSIISTKWYYDNYTIQTDFTG